MGHPLTLAQSGGVDVVQGASRFLEYGVAGVLMLIITSVMGYLLKYVLDGAKADRDGHKADRQVWLQQMLASVATLEKISASVSALADEVKQLREEIRK